MVEYEPEKLSAVVRFHLLPFTEHQTFFVSLNSWLSFFALNLFY